MPAPPAVAAAAGGAAAVATPPGGGRGGDGDGSGVVEAGKGSAAPLRGFTMPHDTRVARMTAAEVASLPSLHAIEAEALRRLPAPAAAFVRDGGGDQASVRANSRGWRRYALRPRVLRDVSRASPRAVMLRARGGGVALPAPVGISPFSNARLMHPSGELGIARACRESGVPYCVPHYGHYPLAAVRAAAGGAPLLLQLYTPRARGGGVDRAWVARFFAAAAAAGVRGIAVTADTPNTGSRETTTDNPRWAREMRRECGGFPPLGTLDGTGLSESVEVAGWIRDMRWDDIRWMRSALDPGVALLVKGVMAGEDAAAAAGAGADAVVVSNHGGRNLDGTEGTIEAVAECAAAVAGTPCEIIVEGGARRGRDILTALALGARAVWVGRPVLCGLAVAGAAGVARVLALLREEFLTVLQLCGCAGVGDVTRGHVRDRAAPPPRL